MKSNAKILMVVTLLVLITTMMPCAALAHNLWLNATDYTPELSKRTGAHTKIYFGFGHKYPVHDFLNKGRLTEFRLIGPDGSPRDIEPGEGGFLATPLILKKAGAHTVAAATRTGFYTMYFKGERVHHKMGSKEGLERVLLSLYYENYAKALIDVGSTADDAYAAPVGQNIEIVPVENPYLKKAGDTLDLKVLHKGRPASFCTVSATYVGFSPDEDYAFSNMTNALGVSTIRLLAPGHWVVRAVVRKPANAELRDKCNEEKYSATLTFEVK
jgi:uncharacterized GH25 family protein